MNDKAHEVVSRLRELRRRDWELRLSVVKHLYEKGVERTVLYAAGV